MTKFQELEKLISKLCKNIGYDDEVTLSLTNRPDLGEYQINDAMKLAKVYHKSPLIIANEIKNFSEQKQKILIFDITNLEENKKAQLRGGIKYFTGDRNNINVFVKIENEEKPCGAIYVNDEIISIFKEILGQERVVIKT